MSGIISKQNKSVIKNTPIEQGELNFFDQNSITLTEFQKKANDKYKHEQLFLERKINDCSEQRYI